MCAAIVGRQAELAVIDHFVSSAAEWPAMLILEGEAGIGKTTLWEAGVREARVRGFRVLACRAVASEAPLSYAGLADLLASVDVQLVEGLPEPQRLALEVALLRRAPQASAPDQRAIATAALTVLVRLAEVGPVLLAIDDLQWLDRPSGWVIQFAARRLTGSVGLLLSQRTAEDAVRGGEPGFSNPERLQRLAIGPLSLGALHHLLRERTGKAYTRPALRRIQHLSGGNPFFALELARVLGADSFWPATAKLPGTLGELVQARIDGIGSRVREALLVVAALGDPTVALVERAFDAEGTELLEQAEQLGVIEIRAGRIRFTHPLLAAGVYGAAPAARRRAAHRRLAAVVEDPEKRARHLAFAALRGDEETVATLDEAARKTRARGAPAAAAELLDLALRLGADEPARRVQLAEYLFDSGEQRRARRLLEELIPNLPPGPMRVEALSLLAFAHTRGGSYVEAAALLERAIRDASNDPKARAWLTLTLALALVNLGRIAEAVILAEAALSDAEKLGDPGLLAQALTVAACCRFGDGQGVDEPALERALGLEDPNRRVAVLRPTVLAGFLRMWTGRLEEARAALFSVRQGCLERGEEQEVVTLAYHLVQVECWRGDLESARQVADDALERALHEGADGSRALALAAVANAAAYGGRVSEARSAAEESLTLFERTDFVVATFWSLGTLGFIELSLGANDAAAQRLGPLAAQVASMGLPEPMCFPFAADAVEALIAVGRLEEASDIVDWLEECGRKRDRAWALALGARCRGLLLAARGDLASALESAERALHEHERLPIPFERARTLHVLGQLKRRANRRRAARESLDEALRIFEELGTPLWADKARSELGRLGLQHGASQDLTPTEERIAALAATGLTNRETAAALLISPKTVEANLARVYRKLDIRSRAELGRRMSERRARGGNSGDA